jgi:hypothetical protein
VRYGSLGSWRVPLMHDLPVVLAVASYGSRSTAEADLAMVWGLRRWAGENYLVAAILQKGNTGELEMDHHGSSTLDLPWGVALLGGALTAIAAPIGISFLASGLASRAEWAGAAAIVGRFWYNVPRELLRTMGNMLEAGQTGLIVVAVDDTGRDIAGCLPGATTAVVSEPIRVDLQGDYSHAANA